MHFASRSEKLKTENKILQARFIQSVYVHFSDDLGPLIMGQLKQIENRESFITYFSFNNL